MGKLPPAAKVYEAYSAIADKRVELHEQEAYVTSSDESKRYTVRFQDDVYSSNDNATLCWISDFSSIDASKAITSK